MANNDSPPLKRQTRLAAGYGVAQPVSDIQFRSLSTSSKNPHSAGFGDALLATMMMPHEGQTPWSLLLFMLGSPLFLWGVHGLLFDCLGGFVSFPHDLLLPAKSMRRTISI